MSGGRDVTELRFEGDFDPLPVTIRTEGKEERVDYGRWSKSGPTTVVANAESVCVSRSTAGRLQDLVFSRNRVPVALTISDVSQTGTGAITSFKCSPYIDGAYVVTMDVDLLLSDPEV